MKTPKVEKLRNVSKINVTTATFFILMIALIVGCKKDDNIITTKVHGHLMVLGTEEIINDKPYKIRLFLPGGKEALDEVFTDENGYYEFTFKGKKEEYPSFYLRFDRADVPDETFTGGAPLIIDTTALPPSNAPKGTPGSYKGTGGFPAGFQSWANVSLEKKAWLELEVENIDAEIGDELMIEFSSFRGEGIEWKHTFYHGQHWKIILPGVGNVENIIKYWVYKNNTYIPMQIAKVQLGEMDTTYFKLEY